MYSSLVVSFHWKVLHALNTSSSTFSPSRTSSLFQCMSKWLIKVSVCCSSSPRVSTAHHKQNAALCGLHCDTVTIHSGLTRPLVLSFVSIYSLLLVTSPPPALQQRAHSITNAPQYNRAATYSAPTSIPTHPCAFPCLASQKPLSPSHLWLNPRCRRLPQRLGLRHVDN